MALSTIIIRTAGLNNCFWHSFWILFSKNHPMKYLFFLLLAGITFTGSTSCNKTFHCTCTDSTTKAVTYNADIKSMGESTARPQCDQHASATIKCVTIKK